MQCGTATLQRLALCAPREMHGPRSWNCHVLQEAGVTPVPSSSSDLSPGAQRLGAPEREGLRGSLGKWSSTRSTRAAADSCRKPQKCTPYCFINSSLLITSQDGGGW